MDSRSHPTTEVSLVIFGFRADATRADVESALRGCGVGLQGSAVQWQVDLLRVPGPGNQAYALLQHLPDRMLAWRLADGLNARRYQGRALQSFVPAMAWS